MTALFWKSVEVWKAYNGESWHMALFAAAVFYLCAAEKHRGKKALLAYASLCLCVLFFFPPFSAVAVRIMGEETYYRILWILPVPAVVAYAAAKCMMQRQKLWQKAAIGALAALLIVKGGVYVYAHPTFAKAENLYKLPQAAVEIGKVLEAEAEAKKDWVMAAAEPELLPYIRQYSANIHMPYGREMLVGRWSISHPLYEEMTRDIIKPALLYTQLERSFCDYVVLRQNHLIDSALEDYGAQKIASVYGYDIYKTNYNFYWWKEEEE